jgi:four helix bundle protein
MRLDAVGWNAFKSFQIMPTVKRFEELVVWQMADAQCVSFQRLVEEDKFGRYHSLMEQMDRSSGSVMDNIAEGFDRNTRADFRHFLVIARGSNAEFRSQLYRAAKRDIIDENLFGQLKHDSEILGVKLHHFISYLSQTPIKEKPSAKDYRNLEEAEVPYPSFVHNYPDNLLG